MRRALTLLLLSCALVGLLGNGTASAWLDDALDNTASGQAAYEDMMIHPQSVLGSDGRTYSVYQGADLAPYIVAVDKHGTWDYPVRIDANPLTSALNFDDTHGAPSLLIDADNYLHVFYGSHISQQKHAVSERPLDINSWVLNAPVPPVKMTYPQPQLDASGTVHLYHRLDTAGWGGHGQGSWMHSVLGTAGAEFVRSDAILEGDDHVSWYAHTEQGSNGRTHVVAVAYVRAKVTDPFNRFGVYYLHDNGDGVWRDAKETTISAGEGGHGVTFSELTSSAVDCTVYASESEQQNQVTVADDGAGNPGVLFNTGAGSGPGAYRWVFARYDGSEWVTRTIAPTDHLFDSSTLEYHNGGIDAFLTVGGGTDSSATLEPYADRGGDIVWYRSTDNGDSWSVETTVAAANRALGVSYNDPQIVLGHGDSPRVFFGEWNNDGSTFVHRVFLWGKDGYLQRSFYPTLTRVGGPDRYAVSEGLSRKGFPIGSHIAYLVSGTAYADALSAAPLAATSEAPVLLTSGAALSYATARELVRLKADTVVIVGGTGSVSDRVVADLRKTGRVRTISRIAGANRYDVSANVAKALAKKRGPAKTAFVVSGVAWADALSVSAVAAQMRVPIVLVGRDTVPVGSARTIASLDPSATVIVAGGEGSVSEPVATAVGADQRIGGATRYEVSAGVALMALDGTGTIPACSTMRRFCVASGAGFSDALPASILAARGRGPLLLTMPDALPAEVRRLLEERAYKVFDVSLIGGTSSVSQSVADEIAALLIERQGN